MRSQAGINPWKHTLDEMASFSKASAFHSRSYFNRTFCIFKTPNNLLLKTWDMENSKKINQDNFVSLPWTVTFNHLARQVWVCVCAVFRWGVLSCAMQSHEHTCMLYVPMCRHGWVWCVQECGCVCTHGTVCTNMQVTAVTTCEHHVACVCVYTHVLHTYI